MTIENKQQIKIFELPVSDISNTNFEITIEDSVAEDTGQLIANFMRNRNTNSAWLTTGSDDSANTVINFLISDSAEVSDIMLVGHNLKDFTVEYYDGSNWAVLDSILANESDFYHLEINPTVLTTQVRIVVGGTILADEDKKITRAIITNKLELGQFKSWPKITNPTQDIIRKSSRMLSGKYFMSESVGSFACTLSWNKGINNQEDIYLIEAMFLRRVPFMVWLCGGSDEQFKFKMRGYRKEDLYIMKCSKNYINEWYKGLYNTVVKQGISLVEVVE